MKILALGDSLINGYRLEQHETIRGIIQNELKVEVLNYGINGAPSSQGIKLLESLNEKVDIAIISYGTNDAFQFKKNDYLKNMKNIITQLEANDTMIILLSVHQIIQDDDHFFTRHNKNLYKTKTPNMFLKEIYEIQKHIAKTHKIHFIDLFNDHYFSTNSKMLFNLNDHNVNDGVHYSKEGSEYIANKVIELIKKVF